MSAFWDRDPENWGLWERFDERPEDIDPRMAAHGRSGAGTGEREIIYMFKSRSSPEVRFYFAGRGEAPTYGASEERHEHVAAATCWALANGYLPVREPGENAWIANDLAAREEVLAGGVAE